MLCPHPALGGGRYTHPTLQPSHEPCCEPRWTPPSPHTESFFHQELGELKVDQELHTQYWGRIVGVMLMS